jgi:hypothetical protein
VQFIPALNKLMKIKFAFIFTIILFTACLVKAQNWAGGIDDRRYNWGYTFQYISSEYKIWKNADWQQPNSFSPPKQLTSISSTPTPGFAIGFVGNRSINDNVDLRLTPTLVFSDQKLVYTYAALTDNEGGEVIKMKISKTMIDVPLSFKIKSDRLINFRAYMLGGLKYSVDISPNRQQANALNANERTKSINSKRSFLSYEAGAGMDFYFPFFKMSTELKISHSLKDVLLHENTAFANPIEKAKLRHFTFSLFFE